ncbi:MAG: RagB/SusD family nutrient uptake outer membrane protein [Bacteroidales bacterium]|nr:RagB/SusD family nutrient uptake outer membrane protein [Bacteroidales bacterium]
MRHTLIILTFAVLTASSCSNYFDHPPTYAIAEEEITREIYPVLRTGLYDGIQSPWTLFWLTEDNSADNLVYRTSFFQHGEIDNNQIPIDNSFMNTNWSNMFRAIVACNKFIAALNQESDKTASVGGLTINQYLAEARAIRAYCYYHGIKLWGDFPYVDENTTEEEARTIARSPVAQIIPKIIDDLKFAQVNTRLYTVTGPKYLSQEAITALLARVYLYNDDLTNAGIEAEKIIASTSMGITNDYLGIWRASNDRELIFYLTANNVDQNAHGFYLRAQNNNGRFELPVDATLVADFALEPTDSRRGVIEASGLALPYAYQSIKYNNADNSDIWPVARVAEMYLISAEVNGYPAGLTRLNEVRVTRGLPALTTDVIITEREFYTALMRERRLELCFEGHRFTDLKRMCRKYNLDITQYLPNITGINDTNLWYPVPLTQINLNPNLTQNSGYF